MVGFEPIAYQLQQQQQYGEQFMNACLCFPSFEVFYCWGEMRTFREKAETSG